MIKVLKSGFYTTIQDFGRLGFQHYGIPISGAMDLKAFELVNAIVGNDIHDAVLEMTMLGGVFEFLEGAVIAITGADMQPTIDSSIVRMNQSIFVKKGSKLTFGKAVNGFRTYIAVKGGIQSETAFKSKSMYANITENFSVKKDVILKFPVLKLDTNKLNASIKVDNSYIANEVHNVYKGAEYEKLNSKLKQALFENTFTISANNSRMAYQLEETLTNDLSPIITSLVMPGTIQLTPSGKLIILHRDCQTTGGYPRILQLAESALSSLGQKKTGDSISFKLLKI